MHRSALKKVGKRALQIGVLTLILGYLVYYIHQEWQQLAAHPFQWNPWLLALAFAGFLLQELSYGLIWRFVLARLGSRLDLRAALRIYLASEFVRYIPGNVWHVLTRILWVGKYGVSRPVAFASMTIELITKLAAAALIFACSLLFWGDVGTVHALIQGKPFVITFGLLTIVALFVVLHPRVLTLLLNIALRFLKRDPVVLTVRYSDILLVTLAWSASWIIAGCAFYVMILALWPAMPLAALPVCIGIYAIGWDIGFVSFITPGGLGFREGAIAGLLALSLPFFPVFWGPIIAVLSRLVSTCAELVCVSIAYVSGGRQVREVQEEQETMSSLQKNEQGEQEKDMPMTDDSTQFSVQEGVGSE